VETQGRCRENQPAPDAGRMVARRPQAERFGLASELTANSCLFVRRGCSARGESRPRHCINLGPTMFVGSDRGRGGLVDLVANTG